MSDDFFIPEERLATLKATPAGRTAEGGYNYQRAYAVARLAAMRTAQTLLGVSDYPKRLRYDWADDLDELLGDGSVCFTQCKRVDDIGAPAKLAEVLSGFAPKWLWTPEPKRAQVRFRLVSCDPRFVHGFKKDTERVEVWANFKSQLATAPSPQSDRAKWQSEADSIGHERLFDALWQSLELVHVPKEVILNDPVGALLPAERAALDHLMQQSVIWGETQMDALERLRRLLHENLVTFDPSDQTEPATPKRPPHTIDSAEMCVALFAKEKDAPPLPFKVVDRIHLSDARRVERKRFLFEAPEWHHVVHGADEQLKFVERDQTEALAQEVRERLIAPLRRGTSSLSALFVTGPPGAGKSTLVRRVAAQLIEAGEVVVADAGHNLANTVPGVRTQFLAFVQQLSSEFDEMRKQTAFNTAEWLKKHPQNFDVCTGYVSFLLAVGHPDLAVLEAESIPYHQWIIAKNPAKAGYHFIFGEQLLRLGKFTEAKAEYEQVLARERRHQLAHRGLAIALQNIGESKKAEDSFKRALHWAKESGGNLAMFHTSIGAFYLSQKCWPEAIKSFEEASKDDPEYYGNHWGIAKALSGLGKLPEAKQSLEHALAYPGLRSPAKEEIGMMLDEISQRLTARPKG